MENVSAPPTDIFIDTGTRNSPRGSINAPLNGSDARYPGKAGHALTHGHYQTQAYHATHGGDSSSSPRLKSRRFNPYFGSASGLSSSSSTPSSSPLHGPNGHNKAAPTSALLAFPATLPVGLPHVQSSPLPGQEVVYPQYVPSVFDSVHRRHTLPSDGHTAVSAPAVGVPPTSYKVPVPARWASDPGPLTANTVST